jgi:hypothetical protein
VNLNRFEQHTLNFNIRCSNRRQTYVLLQYSFQLTIR